MFLCLLIQDCHARRISPQEHLRKSFGMFQGEGDVRVRVRFAPTVARYVQEATWHPSQNLIMEDDGSVLAEFRLSSAEEIKRWIMGFGSGAVVLEPLSLREEIAEELEELLEKYGEVPLQPTSQEAQECDADADIVE